VVMVMVVVMVVVMMVVVVVVAGTLPSADEASSPHAPTTDRVESARDGRPA
jgi:hypothetical protein